MIRQVRRPRPQPHQPERGLRGPSWSKKFGVSEDELRAAVANLMREGETITRIEEGRDSNQVADGLPPKTQAEELATVTPGAAAVG